MTHKMYKNCTMIAGLALFGAMAFAGERVAGTWTLEPAKSDFAGEVAIQSGTVTIDSRQGNIYISRNFVYDSPSQTFWYNFSTDGREGATIRSKERNLRSKAKWDDGSLKVTTTDENGTTVEHYRLQPDGNLVLTLNRPGRKPVTMNFSRSSQ